MKNLYEKYKLAQGANLLKGSIVRTGVICIFELKNSITHRFLSFNDYEEFVIQTQQVVDIELAAFQTMSKLV